MFDMIKNTDALFEGTLMSQTSVSVLKQRANQLIINQLGLL